MEVITQTNRTLLIESINPEKLDLLTLIGDTKGIDSLSDEKIQEINEHLEVRGFDEFLTKFSPVVYTFFNANNQKVMYTLEKPEHIPEEMLSEIHLNQHLDFLKMLLTLIETKGSQGLLNVDFKFEKLLELMSPKKVMEDIKQIRKEMQYVYGQYAEIEDGDPKKLDVADKLNVLFEDASVNYSNVLAMLPLAIEDIKARLLLGDSDNGGDKTPLALGMLSMGDDGELKVLEAAKVEQTALVTVGNQNEGLIEALKEDYDAVTDEPSGYVQDLVVRTFCPLTTTGAVEINVTQEVNNYNTYLEFYKTAKEDFVKIVKPLIEKLLGIKMFFDQYPGKLRGGMQPKMVITNCSPEMLAKSNNLPALVTYLNTINGKNDFSNTVWYAIIPSISMDARAKATLRRERFRGNEAPQNTDANSMESAMHIMNVLGENRVQCFFSFEGNEHTTFNRLAVDGIDKYVDRCAPLNGKSYSEFAIPCMPNFTVVPKDKSGVIIDKRMYTNDQGMAELSNEKEDMLRLWIEGVYIGASYVAAGLTAAYQCPVYMKTVFKRNVDPELPGVRFDVEEGDNALLVRSTLAKEITGFTSSIKQQINRRNFGFVFSSENAEYQGEPITQIMVYKARNLLLIDGGYEPIYKTQVTTYVERILRHATGDFKSDNIREFFSNKPTSQKSKWVEKRELINGIIHLGDDIQFNIDERNGICELDIIFNGDTKNLEIEIKRHSATASA